MKNFKQLAIPILVFFGLSLFLHLLSMKFNIRVIDGGDTDFFLKPWLSIKEILSTINNDSLGVQSFFPITDALLALPALLLQLVGFNYAWMTLIYFSLLFSLPGIFMYFLLKELKVRKVSLIAGSLFYMLNTFVLLRYHTPTIHLHIVYAMLPFLTLIVYKVFEKKVNLYLGAGLYALCMILISRTTNLYIVFMFLPIVFVFLLKRAFANKEKWKIKSILAFYIIVLILNIPVITSYIAVWNSFLDWSNSSALSAEYNQSQIETSTNYEIIETAAGLGAYAWVHKLHDTKPGWLAFDVFGKFSPITFVVLGIFPVVVALIFNINKKRWPLVLLALIFLILMNGFGHPFGSIYASTLGKLPVYKDLFRDSWGYWGVPYFFTVAVLFATAMLRLNEKFYKKKQFGDIANLIPFFVALVLFIVNTFILFIFPGKLINEYWFVNVPAEYQQVNEILKAEAKSQRVLPLPLTTHDYGYTYYQWGYAGPDLIGRISDIAYVDKSLNAIASSDYIKMLDELSSSPNSIKNLLNKTGTNWVILRKDISENAESFQVYESTLTNDSCFRRRYTSKLIDLYEYNCNPVPGEITASDYVVFDSDRCGAGISANILVSPSFLCKSLGIDSSYKLIRNYLVYDVETSAQRANLSIANDQSIIINQEKYNNGDQVNLKTLNEVQVPISQIEMLNDPTFINGMWNNDIMTCDPEQSASGIGITDISNGLRITSARKQVCLTQTIALKTARQGGKIKINIASGSPQNAPRYCIYSLEENKCLLEGNFFESSTVSGLNGQYEIEFGEYLQIGEYQFYIYLNSDRSSDYQITLNEVNLFGYPAYLANGSLESDLNNELRKAKYTGNLSKGWFKWKSDQSRIYELRSNFNSQWKLIGWKSDRLLPEFVDSTHFVSNEYANGWVVESSEDYESLGVIYLPQFIYIVGILGSVWGLFSYVLIFTLLKDRSNRSNRKVRRVSKKKT